MKKNIYTYILFFAMLLLGASVYAQPTIYPAKKQTQSVRIDGATVHVGNGQVLENASVRFEDGLLTYVGPKSGAPAAAEVIDASGKHVYPGFIAANTNLGLIEFESVKATADFAEIGDNNSHIRSIVAYNTDSKVINTLRTNGVLLAQITPQSGLISGQSSVVHLDAWNWEDAVVKMDEGMHINWPETRRWRGQAAAARSSMEEANNNRISGLISLFKEAKAYLELDAKNKQTNARLEAFDAIFKGEQKVFVHVDAAKNIQKAVLGFDEIGIKPVIVGGREAHLVTDLLKQYDIPVLIKDSHALPSTEQEDVYLPYKQASILHEAGVLTAFGIKGFWQQRNLPFMAGTAVAFGLPYEQGVAFISNNTAKILGVDKLTGSLEVGKQANLFISEGDALDMIGNAVERAFIQGKDIDLGNWHKQLYERYKEKYSTTK